MWATEPSLALAPSLAQQPTSHPAPRLLQRLCAVQAALQAIADAGLTAEGAPAVHRQLAELIDQQWAQALGGDVPPDHRPRTSGPPSLSDPARQALLHQAFYAMVALIDEALLIELDWPGRSAWLGLLLEQRRFHTRLAGQRFFEHCEHILAGPPELALQREVAAVHLLALQLGFKGMHRGESGQVCINELRRRLHGFIARGDPTWPGAQAFGQAYAHTLVAPRDERNAPLRPWRRALVLTLALWLIGSGALWWWLAQPVAGAL